MLLVNAGRLNILECLRPGMVAAEIGVAEGDFSDYLLNDMKPSKLHLIDPWRFQDVADYEMDANNTTDAEGDRRYADVQKKFSGVIDAGVVEIHRALSIEIADTFPDEYFDFVYVDAIHTYEGCLADLHAFDKKVKRNGFIAGHDYQTNPNAKAHHNGVVQAVHDFVKQTGYAFIALTFEEAPSFVIAKNPDSAAALQFISELTKRFMIMAHIPNAEDKIFEQVELPSSPQRYVFSFG